MPPPDPPLRTGDESPVLQHGGFQQVPAAATQRWRAARKGSAPTSAVGRPRRAPTSGCSASRVRAELLSVELFSSLNAARALGEGWRQGYKHDQLHCAPGMTIPKPVRDRLRGPGHHGRDRARHGPALLVGVRRGADLADTERPRACGYRRALRAACSGVAPAPRAYARLGARRRRVSSPRLTLLRSDRPLCGFLRCRYHLRMPISWLNRAKP